MHPLLNLDQKGKSTDHKISGVKLFLSDTLLLSKADSFKAYSRESCCMYTVKNKWFKSTAIYLKESQEFLNCDLSNKEYII